MVFMCTKADIVVNTLLKSVKGILERICWYAHQYTVTTLHTLLILPRIRACICFILSIDYIFSHATVLRICSLFMQTGVCQHNTNMHMNSLSGKKFKEDESFYVGCTSHKRREIWGEEKIKEANPQIRAQQGNWVIRRATDECHGGCR